MAASWWSSGLRTPRCFWFRAIVGKQIICFLLEARHFAHRVSSKIGKSGDVVAAEWSQEAVGFHGAADERSALDRSQQSALGFLIPSALLTRTEGRERSVCLSEEAWAWRCAWAAPVGALCLSSGEGAWASSVHVLCKCWKYPSLTQQGPGSLLLSPDPGSEISSAQAGDEVVLVQGGTWSGRLIDTQSGGAHAAFP